MRDDRTLISACLEGDGAAWNELIARYQRLVYSIPRRLGLSPSDADDIFQTVFAIVLRRLETLREESRLSAWLIRVTYREAYRWAKRRRASEPLDERTMGDDSPVETDALRWERQHFVRRGLVELDERCRALLQALFFSKETPRYEDVARELGLRVGSIGPTRARCFQKLEQILTQIGY